MSQQPGSGVIVSLSKVVAVMAGKTSGSEPVGYGVSFAFFLVIRQLLNTFSHVENDISK